MPPKITFYEICFDENADGLATEVMSYLAEGWELYGHPFATVSDNGNGPDRIYQALVKREVGA